MARTRTRFLALVALLVAVPMGALAQEEETDQLPSWAEQEYQAAQAYDPNAQADAIPPPPHEISQPQRVEEVPLESRARDGVNFDTFYTELSDHGTWVETPEYGYVFIPHRQAEVRDWRPYYYGRWIWTSYGWTWVSEEPFGWATYHYGRWATVPSYGWVWVPGYTWGPAWVAWRWGDAAIGWAPLYPGYVSYSATFPIYHHHWVYIGPRYFYAHPVYRHHHHHRRASYYYSHTHRGSHWYAPGRRTHVYAGPPRSRVERHVPGRRVVETRIDRTPNRRHVASFQPGRAPDRIEVYRPARRSPERGAVRNVPRNDRASRVGSGLAPPRQETVRRQDPSRGDRRAHRAVPAPRINDAPRAGRSDRTVAPGGDRVRNPSAPRVEPRAAPGRGRNEQRVTPRSNGQRVEPRSTNPSAPRGRPPSGDGAQRVQPRAPSAPRVQPRAPSAPRVQPRAPSAPRVQPRAPSAPRVQPRSSAPSAPRVRAPSSSVRSAPKVRAPSSSVRSAPKVRAPSGGARSAPGGRATRSSR